MNAPEASPKFNIKAVVLETGIKPHTLRAWEQRYGLPQPNRTKGNHRVYSKKDIDTVKWLMARLDEGLTISRAIELWYALKDKGENPLTTAAYQTNEFLTTAIDGKALTETRQTWVESCLNFDKVAAENVLTQAFAIYPIKMVCLEILQKGLSNIGQLWFQNQATVQQEHFASALTIERLSALLAAAPKPARVGRIIVGCPPYEEHTVALLIISLLLRYRGWEVIYLGPNVPLAQLKATVEIVKPSLAVLAAYRLETAASLAKLAHFLKKEQIYTAFGGSIFSLIPALPERVLGHFLGKSVENAIPVIGQIMAFETPVNPIKPVSKQYERALTDYRAKLHLIEFDTRQTFENKKVLPKYLNATNTWLAKDISAALTLGDINFVDHELKLARNRIRNQGISLDWQEAYFEAYFQAARTNLGNNGAPIVEWLDRVRADL